MKAKIIKTGEIVDVISYSGSTIRNEYIDKVSYIDSKGVEHDRETLNYYWDFEQIPDVKEDNFPKIDWEQRRYELAKAALVATLGSETFSRGGMTECRIVRIANKIIEELKEKSNERI